MSVQGFIHKGGVLFQRVLLHGLDQVGVAVLAQSHLNLVPNLYIVGRALHLAVYADASGVAGLVCHRAALDDSTNFQVLIQSHTDLQKRQAPARYGCLHIKTRLISQRP